MSQNSDLAVADLSNPDRRQFLKTTALAGGMLLTISMPFTTKAAQLQSNPSNWCVYVKISKDNVVTIASPIADMGQHMKTTGPMMLAEEMDLDWDAIQFETDCPTYLKRNDKGDVVYQYADMSTGGSHATRRNWDFMRKAGATARQMIVEEAASLWRVGADTLSTDSCYVLSARSGKKVSYGELAARACRREVKPENVKLKSKKDFKIMGHDAQTVDLYEMVTGKPLYGIDADYPNALQAVIHRAPKHGATVKSFNAKAAMAIPGVRKVLKIQPQMDEYWPDNPRQIVAAGVAVVADTLWAAIKGRRVLDTKWEADPEWEDQNSEAQSKDFRDLVMGNEKFKQRNNEGDVDKALKDARLIIDQVYETPLWAHACMEPFNCIADIRRNDATIIVGHQSPDSVAKTVATITGIDALKVEVIPKRMGGGFGRRWNSDFVQEATYISQAMKQAVKVTWMREDEIEQDFFAPATVARISACLDDDNKVSGWLHREVATRGGPRDDCFPLKLVKNFRSEAYRSGSKIPTGPWRGPGHMQWSFAAESMIDELAVAAGADALEFRLDLMRPHKKHKHNDWGADVVDSGRMAACYESAAKMA
jgi:isoquinoline 1-oxidoreductase beta subunit